MLFLPYVRSWFAAAGLDWAYLAALASAVAFFGVPVLRRVAFGLGVLDNPSARKIHHYATPLLGGAAVYAAFATTVLFNFDFSRGLKGVALGATIVVIIGLLDDAFDLPAVVKLAGQVAAAATAIVYGVVLNVVPFWIPGAAWLNVLLTLLWFLTVTNALQFLDGMDGLAAGLGVIAGLFFSIAALQMHQSYIFILAAPLVGACQANPCCRSATPKTRSKSRSRCGLPPGDSSAAVPADLHLRRPEHPHRPAPSQADPQRTLWHLGLGRDPPGQVFQLSAHRALAGLVAAVGSGPGTGHRHRRLEATGSPAAADLRGAEGAESSGGFAPRR